MTDDEKCWLLRGLSVARGFLLNVECPGDGRCSEFILRLQDILTEEWGIWLSNETEAQYERELFDKLATEINSAIAK